MKEHFNFDKIDILLVDDRQENLLSLEAVLACPEYNLIKTSSGDEALRYLLDHTPSLILMDVQMPNLNGFEAASIIKSSERTREIPIIFVTAINNDDHFALKGYEHGAVDYIYKPYDVQILKSKVAVFAEIRRQHNRTSRLVAVQRAATQALADYSDVNEAVLKVLKSICQSLGWDLGIFWKVDKLSNVIRCHAEWHDSGYDAKKFIAESFEKRFVPGIGLPGKVWETRTALWITEALMSPSFIRYGSAAKEGLNTVVALPISVQDEMMGVLEFYNRKKLPEDSNLVKIMEAIGSQIGQVLKRAEAYRLVRASESHKTAILDTALDCIISMDHEGKITGFNPAAEITFGHNRSEVVGKELAEVIFPPDHRESHRLELKHFIANGESLILNNRIEVVGLRADGTTFPVELAITRVPGVELPLLTGFLRDITERKRSEENSAFLVEATATLSSSLNYEETFSSLAKLAVKSLADWCAIDVAVEGEAPRSVAIAHLDPDKLEFVKKLREKFPLNWNFPAGAANVVRTGQSEVYSQIPDELLVKGAKNQEHLKMIRDLKMKSAMVVPLMARGKNLGVITFVSAESGRRYTQSDLVLAEELARRAALALDNASLYQDAQEAIRVRDEFMSIASHELKTPITSLRLLLQLAQRGVNPTGGLVLPPEKLSKMLNSSSRQVDQLAYLVEDLLDVAKIRAGKLSFNLEELNVSELVQELAERYSGAFAKVKCRLELDIAPRVIGMWDRTRIEQVLVNLISNAIKYAPGTLIKIHVSNKDDAAKIIVQDSGPGIPPEAQARIFERFERAVASRSITGLGLGLFIVKQIVEAHNGTIRIESQKGNGSAFVVELPTNPVDVAHQTGGLAVSWKQSESSSSRTGA